MVKPHQAKSERERASLYWVHSVSSLSATPCESDFTHDIAFNWVQNPFCHDFTGEIAFTFALVWLDH